MAWIESGDPTAVGGLGFGDTCCSSVLAIGSLIRLISRELRVRGALRQWRRAFVCGGFTMQVAYFKTDTSGPVGLFCTSDGRIDFSELGREFKLDPSTAHRNEGGHTQSFVIGLHHANP